MSRILLLLCLSFLLPACEQADKPQAAATSYLTLNSPDTHNVLSVALEEGLLSYKVQHKKQAVLNKSALGFAFKGEHSKLGELALIKTETASFDQNWQQVWGEKQNVRDHYNQLSLHMQEREKPHRKLIVEFRAYDDGVALRYIYPQQGQSSLVIMDELTEFNLATDGTAWWIPAYQDNRYEYLTTESLVSTLDKVHTPLTIKSDTGLYLSIHEANLVDFASMVLERGKGTSLKADLVPWADGDRVKTDGSFSSPWRTIQIAEKPGDLISSQLILNLNEPNKLADTSWIKPHKYLGIWWGMHIGKYTFWESPTQGATNENAFAYIDYCVKLGINHLLIEGWNKGWTPAWYENAMHMFSFTEEAEGFDLQKVAEYAEAQGVNLIGYHETGSNITNYLKQIDDGMAMYQALGIHDIKIGQVGSRLNMKEWHHSQFGVRYYRDVLKKAAQYKLAVNFHEPIKDTGERRTYPNMMTREGARGQEYNAWSEGNPPSHTATIPFTRMLAGPMDFTPGILDVGISQGHEGRDVHTTAAKQLALYVVLYSPVQMLADLPENYYGNPAFQFLQDVPVDWQDTLVLNAEIGHYITTVRKDRNSEDWYLGSITNEQAREFTINLDFLPEGKKYQAQIYADAPGISWTENAEGVAISEQEVYSRDSLALKLAPGGGTAIRFKAL